MTVQRGKRGAAGMSAAPRPTFRPPPEVVAAERRRYHLALGVCLAVASGLLMMFAVSFAAGSPPGGRLLLAWLGLLGGTGLVLAGGVVLRLRGRVGAAAALLALVAAPAVVVGFAIAPFAVGAAISAATNTAEFRNWAGPEFTSHLPGWLVTLGFLGALIPASVLTRPFGRYMLGAGIVLGAVAMISVVVFGIVGGFSFRHMR